MKNIGLDVSVFVEVPSFEINGKNLFYVVKRANNRKIFVQFHPFLSIKTLRIINGLYFSSSMI